MYISVVLKNRFQLSQATRALPVLLLAACVTGLFCAFVDNMFNFSRTLVPVFFAGVFLYVIFATMKKRIPLLEVFAA